MKITIDLDPSKAEDRDVLRSIVHAFTDGKQAGLQISPVGDQSEGVTVWTSSGSQEAAIEAVKKEIKEGEKIEAIKSTDKEPEKKPAKPKKPAAKPKKEKTAEEVAEEVTTAADDEEKKKQGIEIRRLLLEAGKANSGNVEEPKKIVLEATGAKTMKDIKPEQAPAAIEALKKYIESKA